MQRGAKVAALGLMALAAACSSSSSAGTARHDAASPQHDAAPPKHDAGTKPSGGHDAASDVASDAPPAEVAFPKGFLWGSSTAGYQVEKGDDATDWTQWVAMSGKIANGDNPDDGGPDALDHVMADVADLVSTGQNTYRFSIEWARMYPTMADFTADTPDPTAVTAYGAVLSALVAAHITPVVTLSHYTLPAYLDDVTQSSSPQGWENANTTTLFVEFCSRMAARYGAQVDYWLTVNEPMVLAVGGYLQGSIPPGVVFNIDRTIAAVKAQALAHVAAYDAIHAADTVDADGDGVAARVSFAKHQRTFHPQNPMASADVAATAHVEYIWNQWFWNVVVKGDWDDDFDGTLTGPNDKTNDPSLKGRADFLGVNYYSDTLISTTVGIVIPAPVNAAIKLSPLNDGRPETDVGWDIYPEGLGTVIDEAATYKLPILVTENGIADHLDANRPRFLYDHLYQLGLAINRGANVIGYIHWASVDNFEWTSGFCPKYGLFSYDPTTEVRTARGSATEYKNIIASGMVTLAELNASPAYATPSTMCSAP